MKRRDLIALAVGAVALPLAVRAQQKAMPVVGVLSAGPTSSASPLEADFLKGLAETGYVAGKNVAVEYFSAQGHYDRLPGLAADLVRRKVDAIAANGPPPAFAAKRATATIPIVFTAGIDPVAAGLVDSLARPGGNVTGVSLLFAGLTPKLVELLSETVPQAKVFALLVDPHFPGTGRIVRQAQEAATAKGIRIEVANAGGAAEIDAAFGDRAGRHADALVVGDDPLFDTWHRQIVALAARHAIPAIYWERMFTAAGGLMSYGPSLADAYREKGVYVGKILKGAHPADLPVQQPTNFELVVNMKTAKALGLTVPPLVLAQAAEAIE